MTNDPSTLSQQLLVSELDRLTFLLGFAKGNTAQLEIRAAELELELERRNQLLGMHS